MAINYASKFSSKVDEKFATEAKTAGLVNSDYDFIGVQSVKVYSFSTVALGNYSLSGVNRYGSPKELDSTVQEMVMSQDKAFTFTIDKNVANSTAGAYNAGDALARQLREVIIPEVDKYRLGKIIAAASPVVLALTKANVADQILLGTEKLDEAEVPSNGRQLIVTPATYKLMKQCPEIILDTEIGQELKLKGVVAMYDGMEVLKVPANRLPVKTGFVITHACACCSPVKLQDYKIHEDAPGVSGSLVEGRVIFDAFILENKKAAIYVHNIQA